MLDARFPQKMDALDTFVSSHDLTTSTVSFLDILRKMRKAFHENRDEYYAVPETRDEAAQYLLL